jgi:AcrR family transcriptional regulator
VESSNRHATARRIGQSALRILEAEGPEAVSMRRVAADAGVTPMAIYHHFANREVLLKTIVESEFEQLVALTRELPARRSIEAEIMDITDAYIDYAFARPRIFDYVFSNPRPGPDTRRYSDDFLGRLSPTLNPIADTIARWMSKGRLREDDVWEIALDLWAHTHGYLVLYRSGRFNLAPEKFRRLVQRSLRRLLRGLKA